MAVLIVLVVASLIVRTLGYIGIEFLDSWEVAARYGLATMLLFTGTAHFTPMKHELARMVPPSLPRPMFLIYFTGICEILGAVGLLIPSLQFAAGIALIVFFLATLPANIYAARNGVTLRGKAATALWLRVPMQILFIAVAWWSTRPGA